MRPGLGRDQAHDRQRRHRLAAARFADDAERLAARQVERHAVDRAHHAVERCGTAVRRSRTSRHRRSHAASRSRGSSRSRRPSPSRLTASTVRRGSAPGIRMVQGAIWKKVRPWAMMLPQLGISGGTPAPRKLTGRPRSASPRRRHRSPARSAAPACWAGRGAQQLGVARAAGDRAFDIGLAADRQHDARAPRARRAAPRG